jgi:hypothetical protein
MFTSFLRTDKRTSAHYCAKRLPINISARIDCKGQFLRKLNGGELLSLSIVRQNPGKINIFYHFFAAFGGGDGIPKLPCADRGNPPPFYPKFGCPVGISIVF